MAREISLRGNTTVSESIGDRGDANADNASFSLVRRGNTRLRSPGDDWSIGESWLRTSGDASRAIDRSTVVSLHAPFFFFFFQTVDNFYASRILELITPPNNNIGPSARKRTRREESVAPFERSPTGVGPSRSVREHVDSLDCAVFVWYSENRPTLSNRRSMRISSNPNSRPLGPNLSNARLCVCVFFFVILLFFIFVVSTTKPL